MVNKTIPAILILITLLFNTIECFATCDSCFLPRTGRDSGFSLGADSKGAFFDFRFEYQNWNALKAKSHEEIEETGYDHTSHNHDEEMVTHSASLGVGEAEVEEGHGDNHDHNRTRDRIYHFSSGYNFSDSFSVLFHLPYYEKFVLEDTGTERSEGVGDMSLVATWRIEKSEKGFFGPVLGLKLPTGRTNVRNSLGSKFETEIQPGTGSTDVIMGGAFEKRIESIVLRGNVLYFLRNEGTQEYEFGDTTSLSLFADYAAIERGSTTMFTGIDLNYKHSSKNRQGEKRVVDSGADILFLGPNLTLRQNKDYQFSAAVLFPVAQDRGGNHQDVGTVYIVGGRYIF